MVKYVKENYQKNLEAIIEMLEGVPRLLLHVCCAPCASRAIEVLSPYFEIDIVFYNPNIQPAEEYEKRRLELVRLLSLMTCRNTVRLLESPWEEEDFTRAALGYEMEPEGRERCSRCFELRLMETGRLALTGNYDYFATTLTVGPRKNAETINEIGFAAAEKLGVEWLPADFKKRDGYLRSVELSEKYGLYRQQYCGCVFSKITGKVIEDSV